MISGTEPIFEHLHVYFDASKHPTSPPRAISTPLNHLLQTTTGDSSFQQLTG